MECKDEIGFVKGYFFQGTSWGFRVPDRAVHRADLVAFGAPNPIFFRV